MSSTSRHTLNPSAHHLSLAGGTTQDASQASLFPFSPLRASKGFPQLGEQGPPCTKLHRPSPHHFPRPSTQCFCTCYPLCLEQSSWGRPSHQPGLPRLPPEVAPSLTPLSHATLLLDFTPLDDLPLCSLCVPCGLVSSERAGTSSGLSPDISPAPNPGPETRWVHSKNVLSD